MRHRCERKVARLASVVVVALVAASCSGNGDQSTDPIAAEPTDLDAVYEACVRAGGMDVSAQVLVTDEGVPWHVKTSPEVPHGLHGPCFEEIGGPTTSGSSWSAAPLGTVLPGFPPSTPAVPPAPATGPIEAPEPVGATALLGRSTEGFEYLVEYPRPDGRGNGQILVRAPDGEVGAALLDEHLLLPMVHDLRFGPDGLVGFVSDHFNYGPLVFIGRRDEQGRIRDLHRLGENLYGGERPSTIDGFDGDGRLIAGEFVLDTNADPRFVNTASTLPAIGPEPLAASVDDDRGRPSGAWHLGETLSADPACGATTLYREVPDGWERVLDASTELDTVVAVHVTDLVGIGGVDTVGVGRQVVLATECPSEYEGQHLNWGYDGVDYGDGGPSLVGALRPLPIENLLVDEVLSVTPISGDLWGNVSDLVLEVRTLEGESATVGVTRVGEPDWRAIASVRPPFEEGVMEAVPFGRIDETAWLIQSVTEPDRVVRVDPATGEVLQVIWEEGGAPGIRGDAQLGGQSLRCPGLDADGQYQLIQVFYELSGVLLDEVTITEFVDDELVSERRSSITGRTVPYDMSYLCGRARLPPVNITALQLENLLNVAGFDEIGSDHSIDPTASAVATWDRWQYQFTLDQGTEAIAVAGRTGIECLMGTVFFDTPLPPVALDALETACDQ